MKIEEAFRDLKSLFGFRSLVLKDDSQQRVELLWLLCVMAMGLCYLLYEKSGYRWAKEKNDNKKRFSLINVIKRYNFLNLVSCQRDFRQESEVSIETIFVSVFFCLLLRWGSFRRIERELQRGQLKKFIPQQERLTFCQNTIGYGLEHLSTDIQEEQLADIVKQLKRNKAYSDTIGGLHIVALDGTEYFRLNQFTATNAYNTISEPQMGS